MQMVMQIQVIPVSTKRGKTRVTEVWLVSIFNLIGSIGEVNRSHETITERSDVKSITDYFQHSVENRSKQHNETGIGTYYSTTQT